VGKVGAGVTKPLLLAVVLVLLLSLLAVACSTAAPTTTAGVKATITTKTSQTVAGLSSATSATSTTQPVEVWQTVCYEQNTPGFNYSGRWIDSSAASASRGSFVYADAKGVSLTFHFVGAYCGWLAKTADMYGKATVTVDDGASVTVDLYSKNTVWRHVVWETKGLAFGDHTVKIQWTGKKRTGAKGTRINVDAIEIVGALIGRYQQNNASFEYAGTWSTTENASASGGSFTLTKKSHSSMTVNFTGIQLDWIAKKGPAYGKAQVIVDEGLPVTVDLYGAEDAWREVVWSSGRLEMGAHVVTIRWTGLKNAEATGSYINVDAFEIAGAVQ
jgi:trimeric autotransporter adhesin